MRRRVNEDTQLTPEENGRLAIRALLRKAEEAREDISKFYEFVIRNETSREPIIIAPHQDVMFSFAMHHDTSVIRIPVGCGKTYFIGTAGIFLLGQDTTSRFAIVSAAQGQSKKVLRMVSDYIADPELSQYTALVFPELQKSSRPQDPWTTEEITVDRPAGIRDSSMVAVGIEGRISGSRIKCLVADDLIDDQNTINPTVREDVAGKFDGRLMSRLDPQVYKVIVCNTPWHQEDLTYKLENEKFWPTITMDIYGYIRVSNADVEWMTMAKEKYLRPSTTREIGEHEWFRLRAHDPDPEEEIPLWPERIPLEEIDRIRYGKGGKGGMLPQRFAQAYLCTPMSDDATRCPKEAIERCKNLGIGKTMVSEYHGPNPTYTGVDIGIGKGKQHDETVFFTFERKEDGTGRILDIEGGKFSGPDIVKKLLDKMERYGSAAAVENNAAQDFIRQFAIEAKKDVPIKPHTTGKRNKHDMDFGVESIFTEIMNLGWEIPCDNSGKCHPEVQKFINDCVYHQPPPHHTGNYLMAAWIAREASRKKRVKNGSAAVGRRRQMTSTGGF